MKKIYKKLTIGLFVALSFTACKVEEFSDFNSPDLNELLTDPSLGDIQDLIGGMQSSMRNRLGTYYDDLGVIGREYYRFSTSDPRFTSDLLGKESAILDNNTFYLTNPWAARYDVVKSANIVLQAVAITSAAISDQDKNAIRGYAKTIKAYELLLNLNLTYDNGIRVEVSDPKNLGPFLSYTESLAALRALLVDAANDLAGAGATFPFDLSGGFEEFNTPATFLEFNNALAARIAAYQGDNNAVNAFLLGSFLDLTGNLDRGVYYVFSPDGNDQLNPMFFALNSTTANARIAHPGFIDDAEAGDNRLSKVVLRDAQLTLDGLSGDYDFYVYTSNTAPIPIIRNEELVLLFAEANRTTNAFATIIAINLIRNSAGLPDYAGPPMASALLDEILTQRRYSLYGEGHRWIDMRRFNRLDELPIDRPGDDVWTAFPIPLNENQ